MPVHLRDGQGANSHLAELDNRLFDLLLHLQVGITQQTQNDVRSALGGLKLSASLRVTKSALRAFESGIERHEI